MRLLLVGAPWLATLVLALPVLKFPFLWDDFDFLGRAQNFHLRDLLPDPQTLYYRPLSREVYFGLINLLGASPLLGHALNAALLGGVLALLYLIARGLAGKRAGFLAALTFASIGAVPLLLGWISCDQDLLAMLLILGAILSELKGRSILAMALVVGGILSKETAAVTIPAVALSAYIKNPSRRTLFRRAAAYALLTGAWLTVHPASQRLFLARGGGEGVSPVPGEGRLQSLKMGALSLFNLPPGQGSVEGLSRLLIPALAAAGILALAIFLLARSRLAPAEPRRVGPGLVVLLGVLLMVPALALSALSPVWGSYYVCLPALGLALVAGVFLSREPWVLSGLLIVIFLLLGIWFRTVALAPTLTTETNLRRTAAALNRVEHGFRSLRPSFPAGSHIYVSPQVTGPSGLYFHLFRFQPLRIWYHEPSLFVLDPNRYRPGAREEFLFWINSQFDVYEIDIHSLAPRTNGPPPIHAEYEQALRSFAAGRAAAGNVSEAVRILLLMPGRSRMVALYDARVAVAYLYATKHEAEAQRLVDRLPDLPRPQSMEAVYSMLMETVPGLDLDDAMMRAFEISPGDLEANRMLMLGFESNEYREAAVRFARRVEALGGPDPDSRRVLEKWSRVREPVRLTVPITHD